MKKYAIIIFLILGILDLIYGIMTGDRISLIIGGAMVVISLYVIKKEKQ
jgi:membrane protein implicated in regulation of membrane protease activity